MASTVKAAALRFLKIRPRGTGELRDKLKAKGFTLEEIEETLAYLTDVGLLDDRAFTKSWIAYRLARPFGFKRIVVELKAKGVSPEIIEEAVAQARELYSEPDTLLDLARRRWSRLAGVDPQKKRKRVFDFLLRRGFPAGEVLKVLKSLH